MVFGQDCSDDTGGTIAVTGVGFWDLCQLACTNDPYPKKNNILRDYMIRKVWDTLF